MWKLPVLSAALVMSFSQSFADSMVMFEFPDGSAAAMTSSGDISMAAESVSIEPSGGMFRYYDDEGWLPMMEVRCVFELVNNTDEEQFITAGFPIDAKYGDSYTALSDSEIVLMLDSQYTHLERPPWFHVTPTSGMDASGEIPDSLDFRTYVNGEEIPVFYRTCAYSLDEGLIWAPVAAVWKMRFLPGETLVLENTYKTSWDYHGAGPWADYSLSYVLTTGGSWSGPIGDAVIILTVPETLPSPSLSDTLAIYWDWEGTPVIDGRTVTWHYNSFEPEENIRFTVNTEQQLGFWDYWIDIHGLFNGVSWTEEDILRTAFEYLENDLVWNPCFDTMLLLRLVEAVPYAMCGAEPPNGVPARYLNITTGERDLGFSSEQEEAIEIAHLVRGRIEQNIVSAGEAGYLEFLPLFANMDSWDESDLDMYAAMPEKEEKFLDLLEQLESARAGEEPDIPAIRSFYELTGWYYQGHESLLPSLSPDLVVGYRDMVENRGI